MMLMLKLAREMPHKRAKSLLFEVLTVIDSSSKELRVLIHQNLQRVLVRINNAWCSFYYKNRVGAKLCTSLKP